MSKREINTARNKLTVLNALLKTMQCEEFEDIKINALCADASLSQASFYNYFPKKTDILVYYVQLWAVEMHWKISVKEKLIGLNAISRLFDETAEICACHPKLLAEILSYQAKRKGNIVLNPLTAADKSVAYPNYEGVENVKVEDLTALLTVNLQAAIEIGELPKNSDVQTLITSLFATFFSIPVIYNQASLAEIKAAYKEQLSLFQCGAVNKYGSTSVTK